MTTHCDIGISPKMAAVMAVKPTIEYLCDDYSDGGDSIRDSNVDFDWRMPAAVDCPKCKKTLELWRELGTLEKAREEIKKIWTK